MAPRAATAGKLGFSAKCCRIRLSRRVEFSPGVYLWKNSDSPQSARRQPKSKGRLASRPYSAPQRSLPVNDIDASASPNIDLKQAVSSAGAAISAVSIILLSNDNDPFDCIHSDFWNIFYLEQLQGVRVDMAVLFHHGFGDPGHQVFPILLTQHNYRKRFNPMSLD
jgi:hypothetical protein